MLLLYLIWKYFNVSLDTFKASYYCHFGGKAASIRGFAQDIIHAILVLSSLIANDTMFTISSGDNDRNYNVTAAEHVSSGNSYLLSRFHWLPGGFWNFQHEVYILNGAILHDGTEKKLPTW